ncbi:MAG TPA: hypothetical protein PLD62_11790, partial [Candidatus Cloacimonadota bacterium]|nr:hypothetical protein [Candidatus Cloacimonadota bacterium]
MKKVVLIIFAITVSFLSALDFVPGSGRNVRPALRDSLVYYHDNTDDQHWFGSSSWAVKFDFEEYFGSLNGLNFSAEGALIYLPGSESSDNMQIRICENNVNQPNLSASGTIFSTTLSAANMIFGDWNTIDFEQTITNTLLWLVVDYPTNSSHQFISASATGGMNSYFLYNDYYYSMYSVSYESEFLFSLYGYFETDGTDLDVIDFGYTGELGPGNRIYPYITVRNTSASAAIDPYLVFQLQSPDNYLYLRAN